MPTPNIYRINWARLAAQCLPIDLRKVSMLRFIIALLEPIKTVYFVFLQLRKDQLYEAEINGQTINLERVLNDKFDAVERRIYITDGEYYTPPTYYDDWKNLPVNYYETGNPDNAIFYSTSALDNRVSFNFFVHVPTEVFFEKQRIRALVNLYKVFGRTFDIIIIN